MRGDRRRRAGPGDDRRSGSAPPDQAMSARRRTRGWPWVSASAPSAVADRITAATVTAQCVPTSSGRPAGAVADGRARCSPGVDAVPGRAATGHCRLAEDDRRPRTSRAACRRGSRLDPAGRLAEGTGPSGIRTHSSRSASDAASFTTVDSRHTKLMRASPTGLDPVAVTRLVEPPLAAASTAAGQVLAFRGTIGASPSYLENHTPVPDATPEPIVRMPRPRSAPTSAMSPSSPTSTTARPRSSTRCSARPAPSAPTRPSSTGSWIRAISSARRASRSSPSRRPSTTPASGSTSSTRPATPTSAARSSARC